jgi:hypothetical protein
MIETKTLYRKSYHTFNIQEFVLENHAFYEIMWENTEEPDNSMAHYMLDT